ncbi:class II fructose-bisphosphate aldolase [Aspergillus neoniger CBS 115656]|uniref:Fructose-bisphosphate aldolase n=1 Tax=Aspergillus neoniger (strain CBS 115656) TaxID=1448310 RepID=A0A318YCY4_ASPNB|nr:fructose-bisphosphate aldolase [Aspergillus neoniger CBS 115656]PYH32295.1 fructose-bisphosphate aldolase [Aspergillus neoniger CBS 115656]
MSTCSQSHHTNRSRSILHAAKNSKYAVGAYNCYNTDGIMAVIRAAERAHSPAIIQLFPWTMHFQGAHFIRFVVAAAHAASVPIAVHLDHCIEPDDIDFALTLPFDSIMIDGFSMDEAENVALCASTVARAHECGMAVEVELGRIEGGEDGHPNMDLGSVMTRPGDAREFLEATQADFLAPSFGNVHGGYGVVGAEGCWDLELLQQIEEAVPSTPLVLHGTHPVSDELFLRAIECGMSKVNVNRTVRDNYTAFVAENAGKLELTVLKVRAVEIYAESVERVMKLFGSAGKA